MPFKSSKIKRDKFIDKLINKRWEAKMINKFLIEGTIDDLLEGSILDWFFPIWLNAQAPLYEVKRWGEKNLSKGKNGVGLRQQSVLEHTNSLSCFVDTVMTLVDPYIQTKKHTFLNKVLSLRCCRIHDQGEALLDRDISALIKKEEDDLDEYIAYKKHIQTLPKTVREENEYAFLLQFAITNADCFPQEAREIMEGIMKNNYFEALLFHILEKFEYLFFPLELKFFDGDLLARVIRDQIFEYKIYIQKLPGFREEIFTKKVEEWMHEYIEKHPVKKVLVK